jgi:hypothetical protein
MIVHWWPCKKRPESHTTVVSKFSSHLNFRTGSQGYLTTMMQISLNLTNTNRDNFCQELLLRKKLVALGNRFSEYILLQSPIKECISPADTFSLNPNNSLPEGKKRGVQQCSHGCGIMQEDPCQQRPQIGSIPRRNLQHLFIYIFW